MQSDPIQQGIDKLVKAHDVVLFMKGTPEFPQCGFSQRVVGILNQTAVPYAAVNVLLDPAVREGIKIYADWPTIPQLYIKGEFIGGCDIVTEMSANGELEALLAPLRPA
ncbi:MAG: monothiol glutaredoxin, Grx4 family [Zetaproteobacteria bacterium CG12_big_fil_rev_8_21_14_0_65_55_1124]|nr:MAG: monothiol glutaredoxin, Grx4 family [Zetaproteobacteria bacterium CG1_02_55_237]PIS19609.1 MAG: monothiol glutaredoxin, Grx4 family [Zetaproteobacteria bacterium CG08_land_8_20_14_0_20_55_17]PIW42398.1 MAG: monothiol glutaredoxin, Grx4 family [Zetaproteobacteria bacterium CG12_big_fil_rev_8_21_14_0_65_55_1124]PIY52866.1 MAG: monothiol glutaredoxin, Grx4 family [Zetaproteobacteria bacterium CG_4_10_14_0_8_um_filter_55_43]PIZ38072.1 MAG: monothiol glutaredoxin, Grx4 family [Zetaproteobact